MAGIYLKDVEHILFELDSVFQIVSLLRSFVLNYVKLSIVKMTHYFVLNCFDFKDMVCSGWFILIVLYIFLNKNYYTLEVGLHIRLLVVFVQFCGNHRTETGEAIILLGIQSTLDMSVVR